MAKIRVERTVPDGDKCYGDDFYCKHEGIDYCHVFREHKDGSNKLTQCISATVKEDACQDCQYRKSATSCLLFTGEKPENEKHELCLKAEMEEDNG